MNDDEIRDDDKENEYIMKLLKEKDIERDKLVNLLEKSIDVNEKINRRFLIRSYITAILIFIFAVVWAWGYWHVPSISRYSINNSTDEGNQTINIKDGE